METQQLFQIFSIFQNSNVGLGKNIVGKEVCRYVYKPRGEAKGGV